MRVSMFSIALLTLASLLSIAQAQPPRNRNDDSPSARDRDDSDRPGPPRARGKDGDAAADRLRRVTPVDLTARATKIHRAGDRPGCKAIVIVVHSEAVLLGCNRAGIVAEDRNLAVHLGRKATAIRALNVADLRKPATTTGATAGPILMTVDLRLSEIEVQDRGPTDHPRRGMVAAADHNRSHLPTCNAIAVHSVLARLGRKAIATGVRSVVVHRGRLTSANRDRNAAVRPGRPALGKTRPSAAARLGCRNTATGVPRAAVLLGRLTSAIADHSVVARPGRTVLGAPALREVVLPGRAA